ncbi:MAG: hypothetical protein RMM58_10085 [Chloroflexota bacterium]|nr:hypothetical protein [Dehalococcoidia bacterium]MDW8254215.1 hypothetical protein [Chloroflexota bacterium]
MHLPSLFLGIALAFLGAAAGCFIAALNTPSGSAQFWLLSGGVALLAFAIGAGVASAIGFFEDRSS